MKEIEDRERRGRMRTLEVTAEQPHDGALQGPNRTRDEVEPRGKRLGWLTARLPACWLGRTPRAEGGAEPT